jgi:hypothetical protein
MMERAQKVAEEAALEKAKSDEIQRTAHTLTVICHSVFTVSVCALEAQEHDEREVGHGNP